MKVTLFFAAVLFLFSHSAFAQTNILVIKLSPSTTSEDLNELFSQFGLVTSAKVVVDKNTGKSKGFGFVEMPGKEEAEHAIANLNETVFKGSTILVKKSELREQNNSKNDGSGFGKERETTPTKPAETTKEPQISTKTDPKQTDNPEDETKTVKLYVGNLSLETTEESLREVFEELGEVISVEIEKDEKGKSKGVAYVEMSVDNAEDAISTLNGSELDGKKIVVKKAEPDNEN